MGFEQLRGTRSWDYVCALQQSRHGAPQCCLQLSERLSQGRGTGCHEAPKTGPKTRDGVAGEKAKAPEAGSREKQWSLISRGPRAAGHPHVHLSLVCPSAGVPMLSVQPKGKQKGCAGCNRKIKDRYLLKALDKYWHEDCLKCACCDCRLGEVGSTLYTKANLILCRRDYLRWATSCHLALLLREPPSSSTQRGPTLAFNLGPKVHSLLCAHPRLSWPCLAFRDTP